MDGLTLLREAKKAGLGVRRDGDQLVIRGPRSAEAVAQRLLANKAAVIDALGSPSPCQTSSHLACGWRYQGRHPHTRFWESIFGVTICAHCSPPARAELVRRWLEAEKG